MKYIMKGMPAVLMGLVLVLTGERVQALPGQTLEEATAWIQAHPTLQPASGERLLIRKSDTPARRFTFQASQFQVGRASLMPEGNLIRTEELTLFDMVNGVSRTRLEESLRTIYGVVIYQDYAQAQVVYAYPNKATLARATNRDNPLIAALQGEIRQGDRYGYWLEIARKPNGFAYTGKVTVFLKEDLPKLETELQNR
jgi:hypothetical protein